jgi:hypothetical protein
MLIGNYPPVQGSQLKRSCLPTAKVPVGPAVPCATTQSHGFHWPSINFSQMVQAQMLKRKHSQAHRYAEQFCKATIDQFGTDEKAVKRILKDVHRSKLHLEFNQAVAEAARKRGKGELQGVVDVLEQEFAANPVEKPFKNSVRRECMDYLNFGQNLYRSSPWDYRLYGMYRSIADFAGICKQHPVMSAGVIGSVAVLGHMYPFVGAVSGLAILAWAGTFMAVNEIQARRHGVMNADKAAHYTASGENMAAFAITAIGGKGIKEGAQNGVKIYNRTVSKSTRPDLQESIQSRAKGIWNATKARPEGEHKTSPMESFLFVTGQFDNVLLPFNELQDRMNNKPKGNSPSS